MMTNQQLVDAIKANYDDARMYGACLFIKEVNERKTYGHGIPQFRMRNANNDAVITSLEDYKTALDPTKLKPEFPFFSEKLTSDRTASFLLTPTNIEVVFNTHSRSDVKFSTIVDFESFPDAVYNVQYMMGYMNDADASLPLKLIWQRLIRRQEL